MYVGPTSQYPRVDEARTDALYELEVAFSQLACERLPADHCGWIVSQPARRCRLETRIAPSSASTSFIRRRVADLRLGLLELRAFEMAPHVRMGLIKMLLIRALVCMFWKASIRRRPSPLGHRAPRPFHATAFCQERLFRCAHLLARASAINLRTSGLLRTSSFAFQRSGQSPWRESNSSCVRRSSLGTCSRKRLLLAERLVPWTHR